MGGRGQIDAIGDFKYWGGISEEYSPEGSVVPEEEVRLNGSGTENSY